MRRSCRETLDLEIAGLRSYRGRTPIDFPQEGGLIGVIGDTGSGKSSILEAMVAALYAEPPGSAET